MIATLIRVIARKSLGTTDVTHCCEALAQTLAMWWWWASDHFPILPSYLVRYDSV